MLILGTTIALTATANQPAIATSSSSSSNPPDHYVVQKTAASTKDPFTQVIS